MAAHSSDDAGSVASGGLPSINLIKGSNLPEQWTLPGEWNIEKRELYMNWKMDVQSQIANLDKKLKDSITKYPDPSLEVDEYPPITDPMEEAQIQYLQSALRGRMQTGLRRS